MNDPSDRSDSVREASSAADTAARASDNAARAWQAAAIAIRHARSWSRRFGDDDDSDALNACAAALDDGDEAIRASLRAFVRALKAEVYDEKLSQLLDDARSAYRVASMEFTARGINELEQCPGTMPGLNTVLLPFERDEYESLRRSSRSESSARADALRRLYTEIAVRWWRAAAREHGDAPD